MIFNLLPLFLANVIGVRTVTIGLIEGLAETTSSLIKIFSGRLSDVLGQRKPIIVAGYSLSAIANPFLLLATSWVGVLAIRFADRFGKGLGQWSGLGPGAPFIFGSILAVIAAIVLSSVPKRETRTDTFST